MGTRSLTYVFPTNDKSRTDKPVSPLVCVYQQYDGYPTGVGRVLAEWLTQIRIINGIPFGDKSAVMGKAANGMGCLAAQLVAKLKTDIGGCYILPASIDDNADGWQEYEYEIYPDFVRVYAGKDVIFDGTWGAFGFWTHLAEPEEYKGTYDTFQTPDEAREELRADLSKGEVEVIFTKKDGTRRTMNCTTSPDHIPEDATPKSGMWNANTDPDLFKVFDVDIQAWRSFRYENIISALV